METLSCWVDRQNIICRVSDTWDANMSPENWSDRASSNNIIGRSLFEFICDDTTRMYLKSILTQVRLIPQSAFRYYRCDTPTMKRYMRMVVSWEQDGCIRFSHELIGSEPLAKKVCFTTVKKQLIYHGKNGSNCGDAKPHTQYVRCSLCNQISKDGHDDWEDADKLLEVQLISSEIPVIYGICPNCLKGAMPWPSATCENGLLI